MNLIRLLPWLAVLTLFVPVSLQGQTYVGMVDVLHAEPEYVQLNPDVLIFPGETVTFEVAGSVVSHHYFKKRRCRYFGLDCWYEQRSVARARGPNDFRMNLLLRSQDGREFRSQNSRAARGQQIVVAYPAEGASLTTPAELFGMLEFVGSEGPVPFRRAPCTGRPRYCSSGSLKLVSVELDVAKRRQRIEEELSARPLDPVLVRSEAFVDPLLIAKDEDRRELQGVFAEFLSSQSEGIENGPAERIEARALVDVAKFAVGLHEDPVQVSSLNRTILDGYVALGDWNRIKNEGVESLVTAGEGCPDTLRREERLGSRACQTYAEILRANAMGWFEQKARYSSTEIRVALSMLERGTAALGRDDLEAECGNYEEACRLLGELYVDGARMLTVIRTSAELRTAEQWLEKAIEIHRSIGVPDE